MASTLTSEQKIALAWLHGCEFWQGPDSTMWYVNGAEGVGNLHPLEQHQLNSTPDMRWGWTSREHLAHDYCAWHGLLEEPS